ncbi:MAG: HAMP domain-containing sensor histidine kinase, partial [Gammaproteobacteria bacterium]
GKVIVLVSDTGYGIAEEEIPHIFKRFYRKTDTWGDNVDAGNAQSDAGVGVGLGLGLAIASRIIELHGGRLSVDSVLHQGTSFYFSLPVHVSPS